MSTIRADTLTDAAGTGPAALTSQWAARATVNYNQSTPAIISSQNISSVDDDSAGNFGVNYTNAFGAATYVVTGATGANAGTPGVLGPDLALATGATEMRSTNTSGTGADFDANGIATFGDLA